MKYRSAILLALLAAGCARQGYPTGGPKDTQPPQPTATKPANESRQFASRQFFIEFDEYVVLKNADANVLVSPPMAQKPEFSTKGKGVLVKLKDTLQPNTTYLFQFKEAIADFTEGNLLPSYEYVFSTGENMDTMMLAGTVLRARDGKPWGETLAVSALREGDSVPAFVTRTDKNGHFAFHYIPAGRYRLVAMEDKNKNWLPDSSEAAAWDTALYAALDSVDSLRMPRLRVSTPDRQRQRILKAEFTAPGHVTVSTLLPMRQPSVSGEPHRTALRAKGDTLDVWLNREHADSTILVLCDKGISDTLKLRYRPPSKKSKLGAAQAAEKPLVQALCDGSKAYYDSLMLAFKNPVVRVRDSAMAEVMRLKDSSVSYCPVEVDSSGVYARILATLVSGENYRVRLQDGLFTDMYGYASDSLAFKLTPKDYGTLTIHIVNRADCPLVVEVLDAKDTVVQQQGLASSGTLRFSHLPAGNYRLRAVLDRDGNGQWTTGDYILGRQPEEFLTFDKELQLREKWEMEEQWDVDPRPVVRQINATGARGIGAGGLQPFGRGMAGGRKELPEEKKTTTD